MLVKDSADQIADRTELDALLDRQLVAMEQLAGGGVLPRVTQEGDSLLRTLHACTDMSIHMNEGPPGFGSQCAVELMWGDWSFVAIRRSNPQCR
jgi:hypothetical protein